MTVNYVSTCMWYVKLIQNVHNVLCVDAKCSCKLCLKLCLQRSCCLLQFFVIAL